MMSDTSVPSRVFVAMPFLDSLEWLYDDVLVPVLEETGYEVIRADSELHQRNILRDIINGIVTCDLIIVDLTGLNPNVMYELGIAHGLQKPTVMLTQNLDEAPFDLKAYRIHSYTPQYRDVNTLIAKLRDLLTEFKAGGVAFGNPVTDFGLELTHPQSGTIAGILNEHTVDPATDMGVLDFQELVESASTRISGWTEGMTLAMQEFAGDITHRTSSLHEITDNDANAFKKRRALIASTTQIINGLSEKLENGLTDANAAWEEMETTTDGFLLTLRIGNDTEKEQVESAIGQMSTFLDEVSVVQQAMREAKASTTSIRNISRELTHASRRLERAFHQVEESMELGKSYATRVISVLRDRIDEYCIGKPADS